MSKKIVTVFCATGKQGSGCVEYLCQDGGFHVRAATRNPEGDAAKAFAALGAELVKVDLNDKASIAKAMKDAYGVFAVTDFWSAGPGEETQGKALVDTAKEAGVKHFVWSTLDHSELRVPHFETKANVDDYLIASGVPHTSIYTGWFWENLGTPWMKLKRETDGKAVFDLPYASDGPIPCISGKDVGVIAGVVLKNPEKYLNKDIQASTEVTTPRKMIPVLEEIVGEKVTLKEYSMDWFEKEGKGVLGEEFWLNIKWFYAHWQKRDIPGTVAMLPRVRSLKDCMLAKGGKSVLLSD